MNKTGLNTNRGHKYSESGQIMDENGRFSQQVESKTGKDWKSRGKEWKGDSQRGVSC